MKLQQILLTAIFLLCLQQTVALAEMVSISDDESSMRSGPGAQHEALWSLGAGFPVELIKSKGEWLQVKDFEGSVGWVKKSLTQKTPFMIVKANKGSKKQIDVHQEPNSKSKVVAKASYGVVFKTLEKKGGWVKVGHGQEVNGWVESSSLWGF